MGKYQVTAPTKRPRHLTPRALKRRMTQIMAACFGLGLIVFIVSARWRVVERVRASSKAAGATRVNLARLGERVSVHAAGNNPLINLNDGREVVAAYEGSAELQAA